MRKQKIITDLMLCGILLTFRIFVLCNLCYCDAYYLDDVVITYQNDTNQFNPKEKFKYDEQIFIQVMTKNADWARCPLSKEFLEKYNNNDSIFPNHNFYTCDMAKMNKQKYKIIPHQYLRILNKGKEDEHICVYKVIWNSNNEVDDILTYIVPKDKNSLSNEELYKLAFNN